MDATAWNARYDTDEYIWHADPNVFLAAEVTGMAPGRALDLACGEGRNAVWLAEQGWAVTGVDFSDVGLGKARRLAEARGVRVSWICEDVLTWTPSDARFDLVVVLYLQLPAEQRRRVIGHAVGALAADATMLVIAHDTSNLGHGTGGPQDPLVLYSPEDLRDDLQSTGVEDLGMEKAEIVERHVDGALRPARDCLVRVRRGPVR